MYEEANHHKEGEDDYSDDSPSSPSLLKLSILSKHFRQSLFGHDKDFENFRTSESSVTGLIFFFAICSIFLIRVVVWMMYDFPVVQYTYPFVAWILLAIVTGWVLVLLNLLKRSKCFRKSDEQLNVVIDVLSKAWCLQVTISFGLYLIFLTNFAGQDYLLAPKKDRVPDGMVVVSLLLPFMMKIVLKNVSTRYAFFCWLLILGMNIGNLIGHSLKAAWPNFLLLVPLTFLAFLEHHRQAFYSFKLNSALKTSNMRNMHLAEEMRLNELKHMISNLAHDLKTPLSSFIPGLESITESVNKLSSTLQSLDIIEEIPRQGLQAQNMSIAETTETMKSTLNIMMMTINRCIDYQKIVNGIQLTPNMENFSFEEAVELPLKCLEQLESKIPIKSNTLPSELRNIHIVSDRQWLMENLLCLLSNAIKFSTENDVQLQISLASYLSLPFKQSRCISRQLSQRPSQSALEQSELEYVISLPQRPVSNLKKDSEVKFILFEVIDSGPGLSDENIFNVPLQSNRDTGGIGLGLCSLARRIDALQGHCGVVPRSDNRNGACFWFAIPYMPGMSTSTLPGSFYPSSKKNRQIIQSEDEKKSSFYNAETLFNIDSVDTRSLRILLVDDSLVILKMTRSILERQGHKVFTVTNGLDAVKFMKESLAGNQSSIDVILMDFQMPVMNGIEAVKLIRMEERLRMENKSNYGNGMEIRHAEPSFDGLDDSVFISSSSSRDDTMKSSSKHNVLHHFIVGFSAKSDEITVDEAFAAGIDAFIPKPFTLQTFYETCKIAFG